MVVLGGFAPVGRAQSAAISLPATIVRPASGSATQTIQLTGESPAGILQTYRYAVLRPDGTAHASIDWTPFSSTTTTQWMAGGFWNPPSLETNSDDLTGSGVTDPSLPPVGPTWIDTGGDQEVRTVDSLTTGSATGTLAIAATDPLGLYTIKLDVQEASGAEASASQTYQVVAALPALSSDALAGKNGQPSASASSKAKSASGSGRIIVSSLRSGSGALAERSSLAGASDQPVRQAATIGGDLVIRTPKAGLYRVKTSDWTITSVSAP